jgi:hypothetical protein
MISGFDFKCLIRSLKQLEVLSVPLPQIHELDMSLRITILILVYGYGVKKESLLQFITLNTCNLTNLSIAFNDIGSEGALFIVSKLPKLT